MTKLEELAESEGYADTLDLLMDAIKDSVCPGICMTIGCDYTCEVEPDQDRGWCEACNAGTVVSCLVLGEII